jgi:hypothetical protein
MKMEQDYNHYPSRYEIEQALSEFCKRSFVDEFAQSKGIFITNATQDELGQFLARLLFENGDLEQIRNAALEVNSRSTLAGFLVVSTDEEFDLPGVIEELRGDAVDRNTQMVLGPLFMDHKGNSPSYHGSVEYTQLKPGRVQFLQGTARSFDYYINPFGPGRWQVLIDCSRSNDARLMEEWVRRQSPRDVHLAVIDQDSLTSVQTIHFFDELPKRGTSSEWNFSQVRRIVLRRETELSLGEDEERVETEPTILSGITQAILEGIALRNNPFVKQCEEGGYRFTAMTYQYENRAHAFVMEIRAEFKKKPKVFEVALERHMRRRGLEEELVYESLPVKRKIEILSEFWGRAKEVFDDLVAERL